MLGQFIRRLAPEWQEMLLAGDGVQVLGRIDATLQREYAANVCYPAWGEIFSALTYFPPGATRVVIVGQDPYIGPNQAHGLAFSVPTGQPLPPSLRNIFQEIALEYQCQPPCDGNLARWAAQGVLLLNSVLTVRAGQSLSHAGVGWQTVTDRLISALASRYGRIVFLLWGKNAQSKIPLIPAGWHYVLTAPHPSPLSAHRGFFGCNHFRLANDYLLGNGRGAIGWI